VKGNKQLLQCQEGTSINTNAEVEGIKEHNPMRHKMKPKKKKKKGGCSHTKGRQLHGGKGRKSIRLNTLRNCMT